MQGFDLVQLAVTDAAIPMSVRHPGKEDVLTYEDGDKQVRPVTINLLPLDSTTAKSLQRKFQKRRLDALRRSGKMKLTPEQIEEESLDLHVALTTGWAGIMWKGQVVEFTPQAAREIYSHPGMRWLRDQIEGHIGDVENYLGN